MIWLDSAFLFRAVINMSAILSVFSCTWCCKGKKWEIHRTLKVAGPPVRQWCVLQGKREWRDLTVSLCLSFQRWWVKDLWESYCTITHCWRPVNHPAHDVCVCLYACVQQRLMYSTSTCWNRNRSAGIRLADQLDRYRANGGVSSAIFSYRPWMERKEERPAEGKKRGGAAWQERE